MLSKSVDNPGLLFYFHARNAPPRPESAPHSQPSNANPDPESLEHGVQADLQHAPMKRIHVQSEIM